MDIWERLYREAREQYRPGELSPFIYARSVVCALESESGRIYTGFCVESCGGVVNLCAERVAALNMLVNGGETVVRRLLAFREAPPCGDGSGIPCAACREFLMQLNIKNKSTEILSDYETRTVVTLGELTPHWWGEYRFRNDTEEA